MRYNEGAQLDTSQVGGGGGGGAGGKIAIGGGSGLLLLILCLIFGINPGILPGGISDGSSGGAPAGGGGQPTLQNCRTAQERQRDANCRYVAYTNSIQRYWSENLQGYQVTKFVPFQQAVNTACGQAGADVGPFYCPEDQLVYLDLDFLQQLFRQLGAEGGEAAEAYVIAHEFGHHVQNLAGIMAEAQSQGQQTGPRSPQVRLELQADCLAGVWFAHVGEDPNDPIAEISQDDVRRALNAAIAVGDDSIQRRSGGGVNPDGWTHGSSEQRQRWLTTGMQTGDARRCDTFGTDQL